MVKLLGESHGKMITVAETLPTSRFGKINLISLDQPTDQVGQEKAADLFADQTNAAIGLRAVGGKQAGRR
jgi:hypothetical protein